MNSYTKKISFYLPGLFHYGEIYNILLETYKNNKTYFKDNVEIGCIYDAPGGIWNGGRYIDKETSVSDLQKVKKYMEDINIPVRFTYTNPLIKEEHLSDIYCNTVLDMFNNGKNEILCNSNLLEKYLREKYISGYKYISSTTKRFTNASQQEEEINKDYYITVLDYDFNKDFNFLARIENKDKCEILCNTVCKDHCPKRILHYLSIAKAQLAYGVEDEFDCEDQNNWLFEAQQNKNFISPQDINEYYIPMGFNKFKLEGRTANPLDLIEILLYYLIKDEYALEIRQKMQRAVW